MHSRPLFNQSSARVGAALLALGALSACQKSAAPAANADLAAAQTPTAAVALSDAAGPPLADAPPVTALPSAPPPPVRHVANLSDRYAFAERANQVDYGFGSAPPDYAFGYDGVNPWTWQSDNGYETVVEPLPGGGDRYYYYDPGSDEPFLVRDPDGAYGFDDGALVVVYDSHGRPRSDDYLDRDDAFAGRYLYRGRALWDASRHDPHVGVPRSDWYARRNRIDQEETVWVQTQSQDPAWAQYHQQQAANEQAQWAAERYRREAEAYRIDQAANDAQAAARERQAAMQAAQAQRLAGAQPAAPGRGAQFGPRPPQGPAPFAGPVQNAAAQQQAAQAQGRNQALQAQQQAAQARQAQQQAAAQQQAQARQAQQQAAKARVAQQQAAAQQQAQTRPGPAAGGPGSTGAAKDHGAAAGAGPTGATTGGATASSSAAGPAAGRPGPHVAATGSRPAAGSGAAGSATGGRQGRPGSPSPTTGRRARGPAARRPAESGGQEGLNLSTMRTRTRRTREVVLPRFPSRASRRRIRSGAGAVEEDSNFHGLPPQRPQRCASHQFRHDRSAPCLQARGGGGVANARRLGKGEALKAAGAAPHWPAWERQTGRS